MRDSKLDLLRVIGLAMILLAHVGAPSWLGQLRNFDVPLMVIVSGLALSLSTRGEPYHAYVWKRVQRLVVPTWTILLAYDAWLLVVGWPTPAAQVGGVWRILLLVSDYAWIIRVFLFMALVAPWLVCWSQRVRSTSLFLCQVGLVYAAYEVLRWFTVGAVGDWFELTVLYAVPYACLCAVGLRLPQVSRAQVAWGAGMAAIVCLSLWAVLYAATGQFVSTQVYKYPPSLYYLTYALAVSGLLWLSADRLVQWTRSLAVPLRWLSEHSLAIFLWHQPLVDAIHGAWYLRYPLIAVSAIGVTWLQTQVVAWMTERKVLLWQGS